MMIKKYKRAIKPITQKDVDRFWSKVDIREPDECWNWQLSITKHGYGLFAAGGTLHRCTRFAWTHGDGLYANPIQGKLRITTTCGNKMCCNPKHMKINSQQEVFDKMRENGQIVVGSKHRMSKLKEADIVDIRTRYKRKCDVDGLLGISKDYGVTPGCIRDIIIRKTWRHVD